MNGVPAPQNHPSSLPPSTDSTHAVVTNAPPAVHEPAALTSEAPPTPLVEDPLPSLLPQTPDHASPLDKGVEPDSDNAQPDEPLKQDVDGPQPVNGQIELVEHTQQPLVGSVDGASAGIEDGQEWVQDGDHELKRVKVYELIGSRWMDQGTAFCFGQFQEETNEALLIARAERNYNDIVLSTAIRSNDVYQRQQDTLIVWTEPDGVDYALSFQDPEGCAEVWNFILEVQRHMNSSDVSSSPVIGSDTSVTAATIIRSGHLPSPQLGIIGEIERAIKSLARTQMVKERICEYIQQEDYVKSLIEVMNTAEDLESLENLHALCSLMQTILMLNDHSMYEHILGDDIFFGVVGMLEYDPDFPGHKANYREFLHQTAHFHQPIPIRDPGIQRKIHHTYRLQFLKDVVLARALDDSTFNVLNSCIIFNQIDIISHVQQDNMFLRDVVRLFVDEEMLNGGAAAAQKRVAQVQQAQPNPNLILHPHQHMVISLNGDGDNMTPAKPDGSAMDVDQKPQLAPQMPSSPKPANGILPTPSTSTQPQLQQLRAAPPVIAQSRRAGSYAFAPPEDLSEDDINLRREVIILVQQLCVMGKNVQLPARMALFRTLVDRGILFGVQWALGLSEKDDANKPMISAAGEVLAALLDHDLNGVRGHVLKQVVAIEKEREAKKKGADKAETILEKACKIMASSRDLAVQSQIGDALKVWMDVPPGDGIVPSGGGEAAGPPKPPQRKDDPGTERYMDYFYKDCVHLLFKPLNELVEWRSVQESVLPLTREETNRFVYLCDLLYNFISQHNFRSHFYVISSNIVSRVASLLKARDKHLRHAAFRIFRLMLRQNNPSTHTVMMKHDVLKPILDLTLQESRRDNLLSCSCQEYFENMRRENMKEMIKFVMTKHEPEIRKLAATPLGSQRFELLIRRWEMNNEPLPEESKPEKPVDARWIGQGPSRDAEEDDYFNADDDDDDDEAVGVVDQQWIRGTSTSPLDVNNTGLKRKRRTAVGASSNAYRPPLRTPILGSLVDYGEDEEEEALDQKSVPSQSSALKTSLSPSPEIPPSSPKFAHRQIPVSTPSGPPPKRMAKEEDDEEDQMLELLVRPKSRSQSPAPGAGLISIVPPMRPSEKRRRAQDEDDDEVMQRLARGKKQDLGNQKAGVVMAPAGKAENGDDPAKKIKVKFSAGSLAVASRSPTSPSTTGSTGSSETGAKDGDTG